MNDNKPIWRQILLFFIPLLGASFFQLLYNTVDTIIVGRFVGKAALSAVGGSAGQIYIMTNDFLIGISGGATVLIAQAYGAKDRKLLDDGLHNAIAIALVNGALFMCLGILFSRAALTASHVPADTFDAALTYMRIVFCGMIPNAVFNMGAGVLRAAGDSRRPMRYLAACCILNICLDALFVIVLHMGVGGAAAATILSQTICGALVLRALIGAGRPAGAEGRQAAERHQASEGLEFQEMLLPPLSLNRLRIQRRVAGKMLGIGIPLGMEELMYTFSCVILTAAINVFGTDTVAAYAGFVRIESFYWMLDAAFAVSITTFVGQNIGAGRMDRVHSVIRQGGALMFLIMGTTLAGMFVGCRLLLSVFTTDPAVIEIGVDMMRFLLPFYILYIPSGIFFAALRGMGDALVPPLITLFGVCGVRILWILFVFPHYHTVKGLLLCFPVSWVITGVTYALYYSHFMRKFDGSTVYSDK